MTVTSSRDKLPTPSSVLPLVLGLRRAIDSKTSVAELRRGFMSERNASNSRVWIINEVPNISSNQDLPTNISSTTTPVASAATVNTFDLDEQC